MTAELLLLSRVAYRDQEVTSPRLRGLLALLASDLRTGSSTGRLVEGLWPQEQPEHPTKALQILISRTRAQLGADLIARTPTGYRLSLREDQVDASAVLLSAVASARHLRAGDLPAALAAAEAGLAHWQDPGGAPGPDGAAPGDPGPDGAAPGYLGPDGAAPGDPGPDGAAPGDPVAALRAERASTYQTLRRTRALALSRLGRYPEAVEELIGLFRERPRDEELLRELLRSEAAAVGPAAALARYESYRRGLRDDLGSDPGPALQDVHRQLLRGQAPAVRHSVPYEPNPLVGRDDDLAAVADLLRSSRVTSIVGPGGLGKTRLAHAVSRAAEQPVVYVVGLAAVALDDDVTGEVAARVSAGDPRRSPPGHAAAPDPTGDVVASIADELGAGPALLVLDNCEHVIAGVAELVRALVSMTKELRVLTTSRAPLGLSSESVYRLPELSLPTTVELFMQRARAARPGVELPAEAVAQLCQRLDGLPLAVELAAARVRVMSVAEIARRLDDRFGLLRGGARDAPQRHHTLHAVVDWSWNLLAPAGQAAMRTLSVFPGGFTADAARRLLGTGDPGGGSGVGDTDEVLEQLVDQSLLQVSDTGVGTRFRMLETVREFSTGQRDAAGETEAAVAGFLEWAREFGLAHHESLFGPDPYLPAEVVRAEQDNLLQALRQGLAQGSGPGEVGGGPGEVGGGPGEVGGGATVAAVAAVLASLWTIESHYPRLLALVGETSWLLSRYRPEPAFVEVTRTTLVLCTTYVFGLEGPRAVRSLVALRRLPSGPPDTLVRAAAVVLGAASEDLAGLLRLCDSDQPLVAGVANSIASYVWENQEDLDRASRAAWRVLDLLAGQGTPWLLAMAHCRVSELYLQVERGDQARDHLLAALPVVERLGSWSDAAGIGWWLVLASLQSGAVAEAEHWLARVELIGGEASVGDYDLAVRAELLLARGETEAGLRQWRRVADRLASTEQPIYSLDPWVVEAQAVTVVAHAQQGRADLVGEVIGRVTDRLTKMLTEPVARPPLYLVELPICGTLLLALAMVDLDRVGRTAGSAAGDQQTARTAAKTIALAERFRFLRNFQPTMSATRARRAAEQADGPAYAEAVSAYAGLDRAGLRAAAVAALRARER